MSRFGFLALALSLSLAFAVGCDNRTKTEKTMDSLKEKAGSAWNRLKDMRNQGEFVDAAKKQLEAGKDKVEELTAKLKEANPEMKAKLDEQIRKLKSNLSDAEVALKKAADEPEKTWESLKAKAMEALKKAEEATQQ